MTSSRLGRVTALSTRVALIATAIVGILYASVAVIVVVIATRNLTADVDARLTASLARLSRQPFRFSGGAFIPPPGGPRFGPPLLVWTVQPDGAVAGNDIAAPLPDEYRGVEGPETISLGGTDIRVAGLNLGTTRVVVGQTMDGVAKARSNIVLAELLVGPILLGVVFFGALSIGRRVAAPFELARQRQMDFTADASHELRTPLAVIEAQTSLALVQDREAAWYRLAFERVDHESKRIRRLVEDLLWLARFEASAVPPGAELVDLGVLAEQAAERFAAIAETRRLSLRSVRSGEGLMIKAPPEWIDRLAGVLLDNACKYSPEGGQVEVTVSGDRSLVTLAVSDSGPGIAEAERPRIFDRFHRAVDSTTGAGLGLAIADAVVRATGGRWEVGGSALGGARLSVSWPRGAS